LYFGLVGRNARGEQAIAPFFDPNKEVLLEYDIAKLISALSERAEFVRAPDGGTEVRMSFTGGMDTGALPVGADLGGEDWPTKVAGRVVVRLAPAQLLAGVLGRIVGTGNTVVVKPSEFTSSTTVRLAQLATEGGLTDGVGMALMEMIAFDEDGNCLSSSLMDYLIPTALEVPDWQTGHTVTPSPHHPIGAKGVGESATVGSPPAIVNAVVDALKPYGIRHADMPLTPSRVWDAIQGHPRPPV